MTLARLARTASPAVRDPGLLVVLFAAAAAGCGDPAPPADHLPGPGPVPQRAGVLYEADVWTAPPGALFGKSQCRNRRSLPGCELFSPPNVMAVAIDGSRLAVLVVLQHYPYQEPPAWTLLVSDDLGRTVRRFALPGVAGNDRDTSLYLHDGRVFVLVSLSEINRYSLESIGIYEVDPFDGAVAPRAGTRRMSSAYGRAAPDGTLVSVAFAQIGSPQLVAVTRFDPRTNAIALDLLTCKHPACALGNYPAFVSGDGELFNVVNYPFASGMSAPDGCLVSVHASSKKLEDECPSGLTGVAYVNPLSSFGGTPYDFAFVGAEAPVQALVKVTRNWIPAGTPRPLPATMLWASGSFFRFSPSRLQVPEDIRLARLTAGGTFQKSDVEHTGCLTMRTSPDVTDCPRVVALEALAGDEILYVTERDESPLETESRVLLEVGRSAAPFADFEP